MVKNYSLASVTKPHPSHYDVSGVCKVRLWWQCHHITWEILPDSPSDFSPKLRDKSGTESLGSRLLQGHTKHFTMKGSWILEKRVSSNFENKLWRTGKFIFQKLFVWPCSNVVQIDWTLVYSILCSTARANWGRKLYSNSIEQPPTVTWLCTVTNLLLSWTITECLP